MGSFGSFLFSSRTSHVVKQSAFCKVQIRTIYNKWIELFLSDPTLPLCLGILNFSAIFLGKNEEHVFDPTFNSCEFKGKQVFMRIS